jgi:hypothetical protein
LARSQTIKLYRHRHAELECNFRGSLLMTVQPLQTLPNISIAPLKPPQESSQGWIVLGHSINPRSIFMVGCVVFFILIPWTQIALISHISFLRGILSGNLFQALLGLGFCGFSCFILWETPPWMAATRAEIENRPYLENGQIILSEHPLHLGQTYLLSYDRPVNSKHPLTISVTITIQLVCTEIVTYAVGTLTEDKRQILYQETVHTRSLSPVSSNLISGEFSITIPETAAPSFEAKNNRVRWQLESQEEFEGYKPFPRTVEYVLWVEP